MEHADILNIKITDSYDVEEITIKEYFKTLLSTLWFQGEGFSGKRPFGNSGWQYDVYKPLIENGIIPGKLDEDGYIDDVDTKQADRLIMELIESL